MIYSNVRERQWTTINVCRGDKEEVGGKKLCPLLNQVPTSHFSFWTKISSLRHNNYSVLPALGS